MLEPIIFPLSDLQDEVMRSCRLVMAAVMCGGPSNGEGIVVK
jgi:hypothetical protein